MRFTKNDTSVTIAAKKAAMICQYAIHNPLHVFFEDGNFYISDMEFERRCNEEYKEKNGEQLYNFINQFLDEYISLDKKERRQAFILFYKKWSYLQNKWTKKLRDSSPTPIPKGSGFCFKHYLGDDGHIYVQISGGVPLLQFPSRSGHSPAEKE